VDLTITEKCVFEVNKKAEFLILKDVAQGYNFLKILSSTDIIYKVR
jgi:acyl CoA:acetate/3-ketoacid CoA transferase beta subunit